MISQARHQDLDIRASFQRLGLGGGGVIKVNASIWGTITITITISSS